MLVAIAVLASIVSVLTGWWASRLISELIDDGREWDPAGKEIGRLIALSPILAGALVAVYAIAAERGLLSFLMINLVFFGAIAIVLYLYDKRHVTPLEPMDLIVMFFGMRIGISLSLALATLIEMQEAIRHFY